MLEFPHTQDDLMEAFNDMGTVGNHKFFSVTEIRVVEEEERALLRQYCVQFDEEYSGDEKLEMADFIQEFLKDVDFDSP